MELQKEVRISTNLFDFYILGRLFNESFDVMSFELLAKLQEFLILGLMLAIGIQYFHSLLPVILILKGIVQPSDIFDVSVHPLFRICLLTFVHHMMRIGHD